MENIRAVRMRAPAGHCGGASVYGTNYPANADGTITVPDGQPCAELKRHGFEVVEINEPGQEG